MDEKSDKNLSDKVLSDKKNKLKTKLSRLFMTPLIIGVIISTFLTVYLLYTFIDLIFEDVKVREFLTKANKNKSLPLINTGKLSIFKQIQICSYSLIKIKNYHSFILNNEYIKNDKDLDNYINSHLVKAEDLKTFIDKKTEENKLSSLINYSWWWIKPGERTLPKSSPLPQRNTTLDFISLMPILSSIYESTKNRNGDYLFTSFYVCHKKDKIFYYFPVKESEKETVWGVHSDSIDPINLVDCRYDDDLGTRPQYYSFFCRPWFQEVYNQAVDNNNNVIISKPYKDSGAEQNLIITMCLRLDDAKANGNLDDFAVVCTDVSLNILNETLDRFTGMLEGYFFILLPNKNFLSPIYYPNMFKHLTYKSLNAYEFALNKTYYIDELTGYIEQENDFFTQTYLTEAKYPNQTRIIGDKRLEIFPILIFNDPRDPDKSNHMLSLIYVTHTIPSYFKSIFDSLNNNFLPRLVIQSIAFLLICANLISVVKYLIYGLADSIVKPIKTLNMLIVGMKKPELKDEEKKHELKGEDKEKSEGNEDVEKQQLVNGVEEYDSDEPDESSDDTDKEDSFDDQSQEIKELFDNLLKLKSALSLTLTSSNKIEIEKLLNLIAAKKTFHDVNNRKYVEICESNIGNLALYSKKYDKSIIHFYNTINDVSCEKNDVEEKKKKKRKWLGQNSKANNNNTNIQSQYIMNRFQKIIYSFRKFFHEMRKLSNNSDKNLNNGLNYDFFFDLTKHNLENYEEILKLFQEKVNNSKDEKKKGEALLEHNDYLIKFKLPVSEYKYDSKDQTAIQNPELNSNPELNPNDSDAQTPLEKKKTKQNLINLIINNFNQFDEIYKQIHCDLNKDYKKNLLNLIIKESGSDTIETPIYVLRQKSNYLKGKFAMKCNNYSMALFFLNHAKKIEFICDAAIICSATKKIIKILEITLGNLEKEDKNHRFNNNNDYMQHNINLNKEKSTINNKILELNKELAEYSHEDRDYMVLVDSSKFMLDQDGKHLKYAKQRILQIFDNFITEKDRFAMSIYSSTVNSLVKLTYKNEITNEYVKTIIDSIILLASEENKSEEEASGLCNAIIRSYIYLKKSSYNEKEKILVVFTSNVDLSAEDETNLVNFLEKIKKDSKLKIFVIGFKRDKEKGEKFNTIISTLKDSCFLSNEEFNQLNSKLMIKGMVFDTKIFSNEKIDVIH